MLKVKSPLKMNSTIMYQEWLVGDPVYPFFLGIYYYQPAKGECILTRTGQIKLYNLKVSFNFHHL